MRLLVRARGAALPLISLKSSPKRRISVAQAVAGHKGVCVALLMWPGNRRSGALHQLSAECGRVAGFSNFLSEAASLIHCTKEEA